MIAPALKGATQGVVNIEAGKSYSIALPSNTNKSLFVRNAATGNLVPVVLWTETNVSAQQWTVESNDQGQVAFKNVHAGRYLHFTNNTLCLNTNQSWWTLEPAGSDGTVCYVKKNDSYLNCSGTADDSAPTLGTAQAWQFIEADPHPELDDYVRQRLSDGYLHQYVQDKGSGYRTFVNGGWGECETLETLLDMYEATGEQRYFALYEACYNYFKYNVGDDWTGGTKVSTYGYNWFGYDFNDDVMWHIIGAARAYFLSGKSVYLNDAKRNFDKIWNRAYLGYVGLLRWAENSGDRNGANSCINGPAEVAACYIALGTGDENYFEKAKLLYENQRTYLADISKGYVYDSAVFDPATGEVKSRNTWCSTYNQGTMLGAAVMLYQHYGDQQYKTDADRIIAYARQNLCDGYGIIRVCQDAGGDYQGFKGILMRYAGMYVRVFGAPRFATWLKSNAMRAFCNTNSRGFGHSAWLTKSAENLKFGDVDYSDKAFGGSTCLAAAFAFPFTSQEPLILDQFTTSDDNVQSSVVSAAAAGHYRLNVFYKTDKRMNVRLTVNDGDAVSRLYTPTGDYTGQRAYFVTLRQGNNTLTFSGSSQPTIERVEVVYLAPVQNTLEAEYATTYGRATIARDTYASGGQYVGYIGNSSSNYISFSYDADESGDYELTVTYFSPEARQMYVCLNGGTKTLQQFDKTGSDAATARTKTITVALKTGTNTITLGNDSGWAPYVDKIELRRLSPHQGIDAVPSVTLDTDRTYDLRGIPRNVPANRCGLYIKGGKKVLR